jgi:hypothetical protein
MSPAAPAREAGAASASAHCTHQNEKSKSPSYANHFLIPLFRQGVMAIAVPRTIAVGMPGSLADAAIGSDDLSDRSGDS